MGITVLRFFQAASLLAFGILLTFSFSGIHLTRKSLLHSITLFIICGFLQIVVYCQFSETTVWKVYPLITHVPCVVFLRTIYRKRITITVTSLTIAYLFCQPAKWMRILAFHLSKNLAVEYTVHICVLAVTGILLTKLFAPVISRILQKNTSNAFVWGVIPTVYYLYDYATGIYTSLLHERTRIAIEFMPLLLCIMFIMFCTIYYYENEKRIKLEKKEQIIQIVLEQQLKETEAIKRREKESRILRHDMRLILNNLSLCVNNGDLEAAKKMLADHIAVIDKKDVRHFCSNAMINYILSDFEKRCQEKQIKFIHTVELDDALDIDEVSFLSILSNAMDNAVNAQGELPATNRCIRLILKNEKNKLLLSVKNPYFRKPTIIDGLPVSSKPNHGYGTQSIRYMTEQMGGKCQFILEEQQFVLRVVI